MLFVCVCVPRSLLGSRLASNGSRPAAVRAPLPSVRVVEHMGLRPTAKKRPRSEATHAPSATQPARAPVAKRSRLFLKTIEPLTKEQVTACRRASGIAGGAGGIAPRQTKGTIAGIAPRQTKGTIAGELQASQTEQAAGDLVSANDRLASLSLTAHNLKLKQEQIAAEMAARDRVLYKLKFKKLLKLKKEQIAAEMAAKDPVPANELQASSGTRAGSVEKLAKEQTAGELDDLDKLLLAEGADRRRRSRPPAATKDWLRSTASERRAWAICTVHEQLWRDRLATGWQPGDRR